MTRLTSRVTGPRCTARLGPLDPRTAAWREDLADIALAPNIAVQAYAEPMLMRVRAKTAPLRDAPGPDAVAVSELLFGEQFAVLDASAGQAWGYGLHDHYVGYADLAVLEPFGGAPAGASAATIGPGDALVFAQPAIKAPIVATLPMAAQVHVRNYDDRFVQLAGGHHDGGFLHRRHILAAGTDWVDIACTFMGAPYRWGGRTRAGVDCSGLIQVAWQMVGRSAGRDSDMLIASGGEPVADGALQRGDIAWWPGHIGVMLDSETLLHANAHWMACVAEPLEEVIARAASGSGVSMPVVKRPQA